MLYVERNENDEIVSVRRDDGASATEKKQAVDKEILEFLGSNSSQDSMFHLLAATDRGIVRILEDLIDLLVNKNLIMFSELPTEAQEKLLNRQQMRKRLANGSIIVDDSDIL
ncbi:MAG: hypothetical protein VR65_18815 [Desulfobulbaceae bacterium BRH_c16a]|nr:MAG: hypothetical protein VR65_18815 [Desulfobulbaceae bacterium BRH_c16a]